MINKETVSNLIIDKKILGKNHIENYDEYLNVCYVLIMVQ